MNWAVVCLFYILASCNEISGKNVKWEKKFDLVESWEFGNFIKKNAKDQTKLESNVGEFAALREQPVKEIRVKRDAYGSSGSVLDAKTCQEPIDLGFVWLISYWTGAELKARSFIKDLLDHFVVSPSNTRISMITFSDWTWNYLLPISFNQTFSTKKDLHTAIDNASIPSSSYYYYWYGLGPLSVAYNEMFQERSGARSSQGIKKVLVVLADDYLFFNIGQEAQRLKNNGVIIYSVGFGPWAYEYQLNTLASIPIKDHVFMLNISETHASTTTKMSWAICNANSFYLLCGSDAMTLVFGQNFAQQYNLNSTHLIDVSCTAIYNQTHAFITTPLNGCGTKYSETNQEIFFSNTLTSTAPVAPHAVITRTKSLKINFRCAYNRLVRKSGLEFQPPNPVLEITQSNVGNFTVELRSFANDEFLSLSSEQYPVFISFRDRIYVQYRVITANSDIVVRAESCHATPTNKAYDTPQYQIIQDSCDKDSSINHLTSGLQQTHRFSMQVFRFLLNHTFVYIHCDLRLCNRNTQNSICSRSTTCPVRARREVSPQDATNHPYPVSFGPLMLAPPTAAPSASNNKNNTRNEIGENSGQAKMSIAKAMIVVSILCHIVNHVASYVSRG